MKSNLSVAAGGAGLEPANLGFVLQFEFQIESVTHKEDDRHHALTRLTGDDYLALGTHSIVMFRRLLMLLVVCALPFLLTKCAPTSDERGSFESVKKPAFTILIDSSFSAQREEKIYEALATWTIQSGNTFIFTINVLPQSELIDDSDRPGVISIFNRDPGPGLAGWAEWRRGPEGGGRINILPDLDMWDFPRVIQHELGHVFYLRHYQGPNRSVMTEGSSGSDNVECQDIIDLCSIWNCDSNCEPELRIVYKPKPKPAPINVLGPFDVSKGSCSVSK